MAYVPPRPVSGDHCGRCKRPPGHIDDQESFMAGYTWVWQDWCPGFEHWLCARCRHDDAGGRKADEPCWFEAPGL
ncbi:MAG: hypothetical protein V4864_02495 [Pseudomonadota bacterium]